MIECQGLIDKVREFRYLKVRERQINKFNRLLQKQGNITWSGIPNPPQPGSSAGPASTPSQPGRRTGRASALSQACNTNPQPRRSAGTYSQTGSTNPSLQSDTSQPRRCAGTHSQEGSANPHSSQTLLSQEGVQAMQAHIPRQAVPFPHQLGRSAGTLSQAGQSLSPSLGVSGASVGEDAASSVDKTASITGEQGLRPRVQGPQLPSQLGHTQPRPSRCSPTRQGENTLEDLIHKWVINLSSKPLDSGSKVLAS